MRPASIIERTVCALSGAEPSERCPATYTELFAADQPPLPAGLDLWQSVWVDTFAGLRASAACPNFAEQKSALNVSDPFAGKWILENPAGQAWAADNGFPPPVYFAPPEQCTAETALPIIEISAPREGETVTGLAPILGRAAATREFDHFVLDYGLSHDPQGWGGVTTPTTTPVEGPGKLADWNTSALPDGPVTLRLTVFRQGGGQAEVRGH
ncbi:MAG: hypothetical protein HY784_01985, partial [Chloroflexi bacterium]|nr:hypothetical protein [Chloroflexota bacterium]